MIERCQGDIKRFFELEVGYNLPLEDLKQIYRALEKIPLVEMKYTIAKTNSQDEILSGEPLNEGGQAMVMVNLKRTNRSNKQFVSISNFPKPKECTWFLVIGNPEKNELLAMKRISFKRYASKNVSICLPNDFYDDRLEIYLMCDSYIGLDQSYKIDLLQVNGAINGQHHQHDEPEQTTYWGDPEVDYDNQPQADTKYRSLFSNGFAAFEQLQKDIVDDILSDDEDTKTKEQKQKDREQRLQSQQHQVAEGDQIDSGAKKNGKNQSQSRLFNQIQMGIDMLLDSDEEEDDRFGEEDGMIEKDLDNWI